MRKIVKNYITKIASFIIFLLRKTSIGRFILEVTIHNLMNHVIEVDHKGKMFFTAPNDLNRFRVMTFSVKEPDTLEWIDQIAENSVFWDIGANVGLYSIYAAKQRNAKVFSFEPSVFNLELLARNVFLNQLSNQVVIIPLPLSDQLSINKLQMTNTEWGGALSSFGSEFGHDGKPIHKVFEYSLIGLSLEDAVQRLNLPKPDYIKMDVDGIEHIILKGGKNVLKNLKEILLEINEDFTEQFDTSCLILEKMGFVLRNRQSSTVSHSDDSFQNTYNQIWIRK
ncbi:methyltransferase FkbM domain protein [Leptospira santarosai str. CBC379]|uniref:Methyltransferase FkbM domain protein n=1 Tax=Leptospira santarosai str. MOR084 TaxID=1049984 RepID=A0A0E2BIQ9_9LEPT|nr:FkbM family methyltransferase [Leptospira santarosai]EKO34816.1 methyltransferase FkbM domain protein [Leptospira santarosai str. MOR084]EKR91434.1 methyltransferase FkbM domain protein [Leptospira santarosai str. CBC379]